ncbi:MAG: MucR family transcriptional regulator, partial [Alphaproteobacteria bacterium]|nr:MucR family transcriptional regulator [Alphaproteobacteria bacterium]MDX5368624.1 MucR family transcriptional regulator [Alphaproteobacteria bacterium]MDX5463369.1 MucR family transcriptional regulator [Alphaproteobacteria bacterium]
MKELEGMQSRDEIIDMTADIVSAYVGNNSVPASELPALISSIHGALLAASSGKPVEAEEQLRPAVPVKKSVQDDQVTCLICGGSFKSLRRHLGTQHNITPEQYRVMWGLSPDYPMVAPSYAKAR